MCLIPKESAKIADKDIVVYKILLESLDKSYISPFKGAAYQIGELKTANIKYDEQSFQSDHQKFYTTTITKGLHAYINKGMAILRAFCIPTETVIVKAIIPKGAMYVLGENDEIVSTQLKLIEECR